MFNKFRKKQISSKPTHIRELLGDKFNEIASLELAQEDSSGFVVMHGDDGGQIYLTVPAKQVKVSEEELRKILRDIDARYWNDPRTADLYFEHGEIGQEIPGGMNGGMFDDKLWLHPELHDLRGEIENRIGVSQS